MGFLGLLKGTDINTEVGKYKSMNDAVLLDVRSTDEYKSGHIPGSINVPVDDIQSIETVIEDKEKSVFVYCLSGRRAQKAVAIIRTFGYKDVRNIGGIKSYKGMTIS